MSALTENKLDLTEKHGDLFVSGTLHVAPCDNWTQGVSSPFPFARHERIQFAVEAESPKGTPK
jgi:hypothetical protein